jgi:hemerythrin superfamily protein
MNLDLYLDKHAHIKEELSSISTLLASGISEDTAEKLADRINRLTGMLLMHLASEDKYLYPALLASHDEKVKTLTGKYMKEMGNIAASYTSFKEKYHTPSAILGSTSEFITSAQSIIRIIIERIAREEDELYVYAAKL